MDWRRERRVKRQSAKTKISTKISNEKAKANKSLSMRYAELLRLREAVSKTQSDLEFESNVERPTAKEERAFPYH